MQPVTAEAIRNAIKASPEGFYIDHRFPSALSEGFPMYHDAPIIAQWLESIGFKVTYTYDGARAGFALTEDGIRVYRGGMVCLHGASKSADGSAPLTLVPFGKGSDKR